jgi:hypothetical protein
VSRKWWLAAGCGLCTVFATAPAALATGGKGPTILFSGPLTEGTVSQAAHPIPVRIYDNGYLESYTVSFDGVPVKSHDFSELTREFNGDVGPFDATPGGPYAPGPHSVTVKATNVVEGFSASNTLSFNVLGPRITVSGRLRSFAGRSVTPGSYDVTISATNAFAGDPGPGIRRLELRVDGALVDAAEQQACDAGTCGDFARTLWFNTDALPAGSHTLQAIAIDRDGNSSRESWTITADPARTVFTIEPPATLAEMTQAVAAAEAEWIELHHSGAAWEGGFVLGHESPTDGLDDYRNDYGEEHGVGTTPEISELTVGGSIATAALGALAPRVTSREVVDPATNVGDEAGEAEVEPTQPYSDELMAEDEWAEGQDGDPRERGLPTPFGASAATTADEEPKAFAPSYGQINTYHWDGAKRPQRISQTLTFPMEAVGDTNGDGDKKESPFERDNALDHGYEHDLKLIDRSYVGSTKHPICTDEKERFWAQRKGYTWTTTFPKSAHPYFDENVGDNCKYLDFTIGLEYPLKLDPGKMYSIRIRTRAGDRRFSHYKLRAVKTFRFCTTNPRYCSADASNQAEGQPLAGPRDDVRTMECRRWRQGVASRRTCVWGE